MATAARTGAASVAVGEIRNLQGIHETDPRLKKRILNTYLAELKAAGPQRFPWLEPEQRHLELGVVGNIYLMECAQGRCHAE